MQDRTFADAMVDLGNESDKQVRNAALWSIAWMNGAPIPPSRTLESHGSTVTSSATTR